MTDAQLLFLVRSLAHRARRFALITTQHGVVEQAYPPGVNSDGILVDPQPYFFWLIQRSPGQSAADWVPVLTNSGIPEGYAPYVKPVWNETYGLTQQIGADGVRGRLFLPTAQPDPLGYYAHPIDILADGATPGTLVWAWKDTLGGPPYVPVTPEGGTMPNPQPPSSGGVTEAQVQAMIDASIDPLEAQIAGAVKVGDKIALRTNSGLIAGIKGGGPTTVDAPIELIGKQNIDAWESWKLERGQ